MHYHFNWLFLWSKLPEMGVALEVTVAISAIGIVGSVIVGLLGGAARAYRVPLARQGATVYLEIFRNTPLLVQIFFLYFVLPELGLQLSAFNVGWIALVLWGGAYNVENFRAGFEAVPEAYTEAGDALGLSRFQQFLSIGLPIGVRIALPSSINTLVAVLKNSSFMIVIGLQGIMTTTVTIVTVTFRVFEMFFIVAVMYLVLVFILSGALLLLESRLRIPGLQAA